LCSSRIILNFDANFFTMTTKQVPTRKRKGVWLLIPFVLIIVLVVIRYVPTKTQKTGSSETQDGSSTTTITTADFTKFPPEELADMMRKFGVNYIAGECINNGCIQFKDRWAFNGVEYDAFSYYAGEIPRSYVGSKSLLIEKMKERITTIGDIPYIHLTIKNKNDYEKYITYLDRVKQDSITGSRKLQPNYNHYTLNGSVFIECGYLIDFSGYCIEIYPIEKFTSAHSKNI